MITALAPCFEGALAPWRDLVALGGDETCLPGARLLEPETARGLVARFATAYPGADRRGIVSMWSQWYFGRLVIPTAAAYLVLGRSLPVALADIRIAFGEDGLPHRFVLAHDGDAADPRAPGSGLSALLEGHAAPLVARLAPLFGVSTRLLWCNVATQLDWTLREIGRQAPPHRRAEGREALDAPCGPGGARNALCGLVCERGRDPQRRICCLRYLLPGTPGCGALCPLPEISGRAA